MKFLSISMIFLFLLCACEPRDLRLLQDSERSNKGANAKADPEIFFADTSAAILALEKQVEVINALEMTLHPETAAESGYIYSDERSPDRKNMAPALSFHQFLSLPLDMTRQDILSQWRTNVTNEPLILQGFGTVSLYLIPAPDLKNPVTAPIADVKANVEQELVEITSDKNNKKLYHIEIKVMKLTITKELPKLFLSEVTITSQMTVRRDDVAPKSAPHYTVTQATFNLNSNKSRNAKANRTLNLSVSDNFSVQLGACPFVIGTLSQTKNEIKNDLIQFKENSFVNLIDLKEENLIPCTPTTIRPLVDLSRLLRM